MPFHCLQVRSCSPWSSSSSSPRPLCVPRPLPLQPYYAPTSNTLVITGSAQRTQTANLDECFTKLHSHLLGLALPLTPADTTQETRDRVKGHEERFKAKVKQDKMRRKDVKAGRSTKGKFD